MADRFGIDLGQVFSTVEAVEGARANNRLRNLNIKEAEYQRDQRPIEAAKQKNILNLRQKAAGGSQDAVQKLFGLDENIGPTLDAIYKMDEKQREQAKRRVNELGQVAATVLQQKTPEEKQLTYARLRSAMGPDLQSKFPEQYNEGFLSLALAKATPLEKYMENPVKIDDSQYVNTYQAGRKIDSVKKPPEQGKNASGSGNLKSADESLIFRQVGEVFGGVFDKEGRLIQLDPKVRSKVQGITAEAANIYMQTPNITRSEAVKQALQTFNESVPNAPAANAADPQNILQFMQRQSNR